MYNFWPYDPTDYYDEPLLMEPGDQIIEEPDFDDDDWGNNEPEEDASYQDIWEWEENDWEDEEDDLISE